MNIGGGQILGALFNFFVVKKCPFYIFWMLPSVSKITTDQGKMPLVNPNAGFFNQLYL